MRVALTSLALVASLLAMPHHARAAPAAAWLTEIPDDTTFLAVFDVKAARSSPLFPSLRKAVVDFGPKFMAVFTAAKVDPFKTINRAAMFAVGELAQSGSNVQLQAFVLEGSFPADFPISAAAAIPTTATSVVETRNHGAIHYLVVGDRAYARIGRRIYVSAPDQIDDVIALAKGELHDGVAPATAARSSRARELRAAISGTDTSAQAWFVVTGPTLTGILAAFTGHPVSWACASWSAHRTLDIETRVQLGDPAAATDANAAFTTALPSAKTKLGAMNLAAVADSLRSSVDGARLIISGQLTATDVPIVASIGSRL